MKNHKGEYDIIGLSDWEESKHGTVLKGHEIISPYNFGSLDYEYVLIASYFVKEIKMQLKERIGLAEEKILVPPKYMIKYGKPFEHGKTKEFAGDLIAYLTKLADERGITLYLDYGTLLGMTRENDIIEWDDDIDLSINQNDVEPFRQLLLENRENLLHADSLKWTARCQQDEDGNIWNFNLYFTNKANFKFHEFDIGIGVNGVYGDRSVCMRGRYLARPLMHFENYDIIQFKDNELKAPFHHIAYLNFVYNDWGQPKIYQFGQQYGYGERTHMPELKTKNREVVLF
ncbi:LicD family protein [compost metagenome]